MSELRFSLTKEGHKSMLTKGVYNTFKNFSVSDKNKRYDIDVAPTLEDTFYGGTRTIVTDGKCKMANTKAITKDAPSDEQKILDNSQLTFEISKLDCGSSYTSANPKLKINLGEYFNYLLTTVGSDNYVYGNKLTVPIIDSIVAIQQELDASTYTYVEKNRINDLDLRYSFNEKESYGAYLSLNAYTMTLNDGSKILSDTTSSRFYSPFLLMADTEEGQAGSADKWKLSMTPITWGYTYIPQESTDKVFHKTNFLSISEMETIGIDEVNKKYSAVMPAAIISYSNNDRDMYVLNDINGNYVDSIDGLSSYAQRFTNLYNESLLEGLIIKSKNYILSNFEEISTGIYQQKINLKVR